MVVATSVPSRCTSSGSSTMSSSGRRRSPSPSHRCVSTLAVRPRTTAHGSCAVGVPRSRRPWLRLRGGRDRSHAAAADDRAHARSRPLPALPPLWWTRLLRFVVPDAGPVPALQPATRAGRRALDRCARDEHGRQLRSAARRARRRDRAELARAAEPLGRWCCASSSRSPSRCCSGARRERCGAPSTWRCVRWSPRTTSIRGSSLPQDDQPAETLRSLAAQPGHARLTCQEQVCQTRLRPPVRAAAWRWTAWAVAGGALEVVHAPPGIAGAASFSGLSAMTASVVRNRAAIDAAFCSAERVTLVGSATPALTRSS